MLDSYLVQSTARDLIAASTGISTCAVIADDGYTDTKIEAALRDDGFCIVVRMVSGIDIVEQTRAVQFGVAPIVIHLLENPFRNPQDAGLKLNMQQVIQAVTIALQQQIDGEQHFRVTGVSLIDSDEGLLAYEITATAATSGL